jgi:nickel transport protein
MKNVVVALMILSTVAGFYSPAIAHSIHYRVENKGITVRVFYAADDPASYSSYEIFGPGDTIPHQKGRTDRNGFLLFLPDRQGKWVIKVSGESEHGMHGAQIEVDVNENLFMESFKKPLVAQYIAAFVGISFVLFIFSVWTLIKTRKKRTNNSIQK